MNQTLRVAGVSKSTWYYYQKEKVDYEEKYSHVRIPILNAIKENPAYGWRKLQDELEEDYGIALNHKPLKNLLNLWDLALPRTVKRPRKNRIAKLIQEIGDKANLLRDIDMSDIQPFQVLVTDFTWLYYHSGQKRMALIGFEDIACKVIYGYAIGKSQDTELALRAWAEAKKKLLGVGATFEGMIVHQDQDPVFTGYEYVRQMVLEDGLRLSYSKKATPGDNASKESFFGHFKTENKSLFLNAKTSDELIEIAAERMNYYNEKRRHQSLGNIAPLKHLERWKCGL